MATLITGTASTSNLSITGESVPVGSCARTDATLSRTSCAATSRGFSRTKLTTMAETPSRVVLRSSSMPSIVLMASSSTLVTPVSMSSTPAPFSVVVTVTIGKSTFGKRSTPSARYENRPSTTAAATSMVASTGRRMKTSAKRTALASGLGAGFHAGADHDRRAIGEARQAARRHVHAARDALHDLDPAVPQVDAERDRAL